MADYISRKSAVDALTKVALRVADSKRRTVATCINEIELLPAIGSYDRLRELAEADKAGRLVVLPCKVGDVVYGFHGKKTILPIKQKWTDFHRKSSRSQNQPWFHSRVPGI